MNIAILIPTLGQGGAEKQAALLATMLDKHHHVYMFILYGDSLIAPQNIELLNKSNVELHLLNGNILSKFVSLKKELKGKQIDVLFNYLTSCDIIGALAARMGGIKYVYSGIRNSQLEWHKMLADKIIHNHIASGSIYNCHSGASYFTSKGFNKDKNIVIPNGFLNIADPIIRDDRDVKHIVTTGRFVPQKDYYTMIKAISKLKEMRQDFTMDIIGYGVEEKNILSWIEEFDISDKVNIYIKPDNVQDIVRDADIYLSTSLYEGTSNSIMEALNWSLPIVATNVGDNNYLVIDGKNGSLHSIGDVTKIAQSLSELLDNVKLRNDYGLNSHNILKKNYSIEAFENKYLQLINSL